jgi:hypothetical protein
MSNRLVSFEDFINEKPIEYAKIAKGFILKLIKIFISEKRIYGNITVRNVLVSSTGDPIIDSGAHYTSPINSYDMYTFLKSVYKLEERFRRSVLKADIERIIGKEFLESKEDDPEKFFPTSETKSLIRMKNELMGDSPGKHINMFAPGERPPKQAPSPIREPPSFPSPVRWYQPSQLSFSSPSPQVVPENIKPKVKPNPLKNADILIENGRVKLMNPLTKRWDIIRFFPKAFIWKYLKMNNILDMSEVRARNIVRSDVHGGPSELELYILAKLSRRDGIKTIFKQQRKTRL